MSDEQPPKGWALGGRMSDERDETPIEASYPARACARASAAPSLHEPVLHAARMRSGYAVTACGIIIRHPLYYPPREPYTCRNCARRLDAHRDAI